MARYGDDNNSGTGPSKTRLADYFYDTSIQCPYGLNHTAVYRQALFGTLTERILGTFLASGYRRNGNCIYTMACPECSACIPLRIDPVEFVPNRNQKRVIKKNRDVSAKIRSLEISAEKLDLCNTYLRTRYPGKGSTAEEYYTFFFLNSGDCTFEISYRTEKRLIGVAIVDVSPDWLNAVYFYFDPREAKRSPGTYNVLHLIDFCKQHRIKSLYLGYWIKEVRAMSYKANFKPHYLLENNIWRTVARSAVSRSKPARN